MKRLVIAFTLLLAIGFVSYGQSDDPLATSCAMNSGADAKYLKDFRVQLGKASVQGELRYKANMSLWQNTKYRFTLCNTPESKSPMILSIRDEVNNVVLLSYDKNSGKTFSSVDFVCHKSGIYTLSYDFSGQDQGSGVGVVSIVK